MIRLAPAQRDEGLAQPESAIAGVTDFKFEARKIEGGRGDEQARNRGRQHRRVHGRLTDQHVIGGKAPARTVDAEASGIAADSLAPRRIGEQVFPIASRYVSSVYLVSDDDIRTAQRALWDNLRIIAEPGGAAAFASLLSGKYKPAAGEQVGVVISGGNTVAVNFDLQEKRTNT